MIVLLAVGLTVAAGLAIAQSARLYLCESERDDFQLKWEQSLNARNSSDAVVHEFTNCELISKWEKVYPHVQNMMPHRKYSEWATFCANYPSRTAMLRQLGREA